MNRLLFLALIVCVIFDANAQETKSIIVKTSQTIEEFDVLRHNKKIKNGAYLKKYNHGNQVVAKGQFINNKKIGTWDFFDFRTGDLEQRFDFDRNKCLFLNLESSEQNHFIQNGEWILDKLDTIPVVIGGLSNLKLDLIDEAYKCTEKALYMNSSIADQFPKAGFAIFSFVVTKSGETKNFKILLSSGNTFEDELLEKIENTRNDWLPGIYKHETVDTEFLIPMYVKYIVNTEIEKLYTIEFDYPKIE